MLPEDFERFWQESYPTFRHAAEHEARLRCDLPRDREAAANDGLAEAYFDLRNRHASWWDESLRPVARVCSVVRLHVKSEARKIRRQSGELGDGSQVDLASTSDELVDFVDRQGWRDALADCQARLPGPLQDVILLYADFGNLRDAARVAGLDKETFRRRLVDALQRLRLCLTRNMNDD